MAVHEAGHALVAALSEHADPVAKVTILPAGQALGVTEQLPVDERHLYAESYLHDSLAVRLGGRAAEILVLGEASTGAANDLAGATELAIRMVREFGMSERLGPVGFASGSPMYLGGEEVRSRTYAEDTQRVIDEEVRGPAPRGRAAGHGAAAATTATPSTGWSRISSPTRPSTATPCKPPSQAMPAHRPGRQRRPSAKLDAITRLRSGAKPPQERAPGGQGADWSTSGAPMNSTKAWDTKPPAT